MLRVHEPTPVLSENVGGLDSVAWQAITDELGETLAPTTSVHCLIILVLILRERSRTKDGRDLHAWIGDSQVALFLGRTSRIRRRRAGSVADTTDAIQAVACIRFVRLACAGRVVH